jgi:hypothetical protein
MAVRTATREKGATMDKDQNREPDKDEAEGAEDLEVSGDEAEGVAGGVRRGGDLDAGAQRL